MASWGDFEHAAPELARLVRARLDAHGHKTLATLRRDGAPRISGTETELLDGELWWGSMPGALKARDLQRDPRFALHSGSDDPPGWRGDAKLAGRAVEVTGDADKQAVLDAYPSPVPPGPMHLFRAELTEVSHVALNAAGDGIELTVWTPERGVRRLDRR